MPEKRQTEWKKKIHENKSKDNEHIFSSWNEINYLISKWTKLSTLNTQAKKNGKQIKQTFLPKITIS